MTAPGGKLGQVVRLSFRRLYPPQRELLTEREEEHSYIYAGGKLLRETVFIVDEQGSEIERTLDYRYDNAGLPYALHYKDDFEGIEQTYYYITNLQGDVMYIVDESGDEVASYEYDPYGKLTRTTGNMAEVNPIRYRSYYYDNDTDFYYVSSRYYDSQICRFINADDCSYAGADGMLPSYNLFVYCFNNPINMLDRTGSWPSLSQVFSAVATVAVAAVFVTAVVMSAGAVGVAAGVAAASVGATGTMVSAAITAGTIGTYVVAGGIGACALSNAGETLTGTNVIRDKLMKGNQKAYDAVQAVLNILGGGAVIIGQTNPGVTGKSAKPDPDAQYVHKVPTEGTPKTSFDKLYKGNASNFERTYYDYKGNISFQIDFTQHNNPSAHSMPHLHVWGPNGRSGQINLWYLQ